MPRRYRPQRGFTLIELLIVVIIIAAIGFGVSRACRSRSSEAVRENTTAEVVQAGVGIRYQPPVVPISISVGTDGVSVSIDGHVQLPIGTFTAYGNVVAPLASPATKTLTLVAGPRGYVYPLDNRRFEVRLPNDLHGRSKLSYDGQGNIRVEIPTPVSKKYLEGACWSELSLTVVPCTHRATTWRPFDRRPNSR